MIRIFVILIIFISDVEALELSGSFTQGGLIIGKLKLDEKYKVIIDEKKIKINEDGYFIFGISRNRIKDISIKIKAKGFEEKIVKKISKRKFKIQRIDGLPKRKVTPNEEDMKRIRKEGRLISVAKNQNSDLSFFFKGFIRPVDGITTGVYGSQRILNGKPRTPHYGIDIAAPSGTKIKNSNSGKVILAQKDLFFTGGTIIIDHGHGLISIYSHLKDLFVKEDDFVKKGKIIATVGSTGRSTGPHLDFRLYCKNIAIDPDLIIPKN
jgi:murein DD-endopeptidase MepM/ murein hydrolase activator NlpD